MTHRTYSNRYAKTGGNTPAGEAQHVIDAIEALLEGRDENVQKHILELIRDYCMARRNVGYSRAQLLTWSDN